MRTLLIAFLGLTFATTTLATGVNYKTVQVDDLEVFYREAGDPEKKTILLLHGFPTSSQMYQELIVRLSDQYHLVAPDYPGFGLSSQPPMSEFEYSFESLTDVVEKFTKAVELDRYSLYVMDYGAPIGYRLALRNPSAIESLIIQNGNAYEEGLKEFWDPVREYWAEPTPEHGEPLEKFITTDGVRWQYTHGTRNPDQINPDNWTLDRVHLSKLENPEIQLKLFHSYQTNVPLYQDFQSYFRTHSPPTLIVWGKGDYIFPPDGAYPYKRDLPEAEIHLLDTGHFALEEELETIAELIEGFLK